MNLKNEMSFRVLEDRGQHFLLTIDGVKTWLGELNGRLKKGEVEGKPTTGDMVRGILQPGDWISIEEVLPRKNLLVRQAAGSQDLQKLGANIDYLLVAMAMNQDFNLNRLDRYVSMSLACQIQPVVVLTKADLAEDPYHLLDQTGARFPDLEIHAISVKEGWNLDSLQKYLQAGLTVALVGSSGVGKSTLTNCLLGAEVLDTGEIREDDGKGKHTTSYRSLHLLHNGAWIMDTPGLRSLALWSAEEGLSQLFEDIENLRLQCRFNDCRHETEPGCKILSALQSGVLEEQRWQSYLKLKREQDFLKRKTDKAAASAQKEVRKKRTKQFRQQTKVRERY